MTPRPDRGSDGVPSKSQQKRLAEQRGEPWPGVPREDWPQEFDFEQVEKYLPALPSAKRVVAAAREADAMHSALRNLIAAFEHEVSTRECDLESLRRLNEARAALRGQHE